MRPLLPVLLFAAASVLSTPAAAQAPASAWRTVPRLDSRLAYVVVQAGDAAALAAVADARPPAVAQPERQRHSTARLAFGGVVGGGLGLVGGWVAGVLLQGEPDPRCIDMCFGLGPVLGVLAGEALGIGLGVNLANGARGHTGLTVLASSAILAAGVVMLTETIDGGVILAIPVTQIIGAITVERRTEQARMRRRAGR
ncbi:MAG TPA: hypothetical protein VFQ45_04635 [Longimicrobium sp.]|nr:hypothetical protein [Longimicrobium sp.]